MTAETIDKQEVLENFWLNSQEINSSVLDLFFTILKQIHAGGKKAVQQYLVKPLREAFPRPDSEDIDELRKNLELHKKIKAYKKLGNIYRKMVIAAIWEPHPKKLLSVLSSLLLDLEAYPDLRKSAFAKEFFDAVRTPFYKFHREHFEEIDHEFEQALKESGGEISPTMIAKHEASAALKKKLAKEATELFRKIEQAYVMGNKPRLTYLLAQYTGRFANFPDAPYRDEVDKIIEGLATNDPGIYKEIKDRLAVKIYQSIVNALKKKDLQTAIRGIATFALTFQGETDIPYRKELDLLEEKLYSFISQNNLWDSFKK